MRKPNPNPLDVAILALWGAKVFTSNPGQIQDRIYRFVNYMTPVHGPDRAFTASELSGLSRMPLRQVERALERLKKNRKVQRAQVAGQFWYSIPGRMPKEFLMVRANPDAIDMALLGLQAFKTFQPGPKSNPPQSVWKASKAGPAQARQKIRQEAGKQYGGPNSMYTFYKDDGCVACWVDGYGHAGIFVGVWDRKKCGLKIMESMRWTWWGDSQPPAFEIFVYEEDCDWAYFVRDNKQVAKKLTQRAWKLKGKALTKKHEETYQEAIKSIEHWGSKYPKRETYISNPRLKRGKSKMKLPQYIAQWVKREFAPQYHAQVTEGLIDVAAGNRPGNQFERDAISRIMKSYNRKKYGKKKARKKNPRGTGSKLGIRKHKLLTKAIEKKLPALYATENVPLEQKVAYVKFFTPDSNWTWYGLEYDPKTRTFFGWVVGHEKELGYFSLDELESARGPMRLPIERDKWFSPTPLGVLMKQS